MRVVNLFLYYHDREEIIKKCSLKNYLFSIKVLLKILFIPHASFLEVNLSRFKLDYFNRLLEKFNFQGIDENYQLFFL